MFVVKDTGIGIGKEHMDSIFTSFTQVDNTVSRRYQGTGLGLTISRRLCQLMGGDISVTSEPGIGSEFSFSILFAEKDEQKLKEEKENPALVDLPTRSLRILLVEDNETNRDLGRMILENMGHVVLPAVNGLEALEILAVEEADVVLMDIQMPVMDGYAATRTIREFEHDHTASTDLPSSLSQRLKTKLAGGHLNIIALTAHAMAGDRQKCLDAGMDEYLTKPFIPDQVASALALACAAESINLLAPTSPAQEEAEVRRDDIRIRILDHLQQRFGLAGDKAEILLATTSRTIEADMAKITHAYHEKDLKGVGDAAHSLKGLLLNLGLQDQVETVEKIERACRVMGSLPDEQWLKELSRDLVVLLGQDIAGK